MGVDAAIGAVAERQYGAFSARQARQLGANRNLAARRVAAGRWLRVTSRVFVMAGTPASAEQELTIALLHAGPTAIASHQSAAWLWRLPGFADHDVVLRSRAHGSGVEDGHRPTLVLPHHRTEVGDIPCTTLPRTVFDLAGVLRPGRTAALVNTVVTRSPAMLPALHRMLPELAKRGRPGITVMREILAANPVGTAVPASGNEARFEQIMWNAGIRELERQVDVGGHSWLGRVDYLLRRVGLIIEVDSRLHHSSPLDRLRDAERDAGLLAAGFRRVLRISAEDLWPQPYLVVDAVLDAIAGLEAGLPDRSPARNAS